MKKIMAFCLFAFVMVLGSQTAMAQSKEDVKTLAAEKTMELDKLLKLNNKEEGLVYEAFQEYEKKKFKVDKMIATGNGGQEESKKLNMAFEEKMKSILTSEQFEIYQKYKQPK